MWLRESPICLTAQLVLILGLLCATSAESIVIAEERPRVCTTYGDCGGLPCVNGTVALPFIPGGSGMDIIREICPHLKVG